MKHHWVTDEQQKAFVQAYVAALPDRIVLTEERKQRALRQAQGAEELA